MYEQSIVSCFALSVDVVGGKIEGSRAAKPHSIPRTDQPNFTVITHLCP